MFVIRASFAVINLPVYSTKALTPSFVFSKSVPAESAVSFTSFLYSLDASLTFSKAY